MILIGITGLTFQKVKPEAFRILSPKYLNLRAEWLDYEGLGNFLPLLWLHGLRYFGLTVDIHSAEELKKFEEMIVIVPKYLQLSMWVDCTKEVTHEHLLEFLTNLCKKWPSRNIHWIGMGVTIALNKGDFMEQIEKLLTESKNVDFYLMSWNTIDDICYMPKTKYFSVNRE